MLSHPPISNGKLPDIKFCPALKVFKFFRLPKESGNDPLMLLLYAINSEREERFPNSKGKGPDILLLHMFKVVREESAVNSTGI
uniref:Uncharacterized protein n=1 Tax=Rhizophora mucronata TaxID=61149 RepID=A0A2P2Q316_RHIMU